MFFFFIYYSILIYFDSVNIRPADVVHKGDITKDNCIVNEHTITPYEEMVEKKKKIIY